MIVFAILTVYAVTVVLLGCCWILADITVPKKILLTAVYSACWGISWTNVYYGAAAQCAVALLLGGVTWRNSSRHARRE
jgi:hypothetical protein